MSVKREINPVTYEGDIAKEAAVVVAAVSVSVQVIDKTKSYRVLKTIGSSKDSEEISRMVKMGKVFYTIYKELERLLSKHRLPISSQRAIELTQTMYELTFDLPNDQEFQRVLLKMDTEQQMLYDLLY